MGGIDDTRLEAFIIEAFDVQELQRLDTSRRYSTELNFDGELAAVAFRFVAFLRRQGDLADGRFLHELAAARPLRRSEIELLWTAESGAASESPGPGQSEHYESCSRAPAPTSTPPANAPSGTTRPTFPPVETAGHQCRIGLVYDSKDVNPRSVQLLHQFADAAQSVEGTHVVSEVLVFGTAHKTAPTRAAVIDSLKRRNISARAAEFVEIQSCVTVVSIGGSDEVLHPVWLRFITRPTWRPWVGLPAEPPSFSDKLAAEMLTSTYGPTVRALSWWQADRIARADIDPALLTTVLRSAMSVSVPPGELDDDISSFFADVRATGGTWALRLQSGRLLVPVLIPLTLIAAIFLAATTGVSIGLFFTKLDEAEARTHRRTAPLTLLRPFLCDALDLDPSACADGRLRDEAGHVDSLLGAPFPKEPGTADKATQWNVMTESTSRTHPSVKVVEYVWSKTRPPPVLDEVSAAAGADQTQLNVACAHEGQLLPADGDESTTKSAVSHLGRFTIGNVDLPYTVTCVTIYSRDQDDAHGAYVMSSRRARVGSAGSFHWYVGRRGPHANLASQFYPVKVLSDGTWWIPKELSPLPFTASVPTAPPSNRPTEFLPVLNGVTHPACRQEPRTAPTTSFLEALGVVLPQLGFDMDAQCTATETAAGGLTWFVPPENQLSAEPDVWYLIGFGRRPNTAAGSAAAPGATSPAPVNASNTSPPNPGTPAPGAP